MPKFGFFGCIEMHQHDIQFSITSVKTLPCAVLCAATRWWLSDQFWYNMLKHKVYLHISNVFLTHAEANK